MEPLGEGQNQLNIRVGASVGGGGGGKGEGGEPKGGVLAHVPERERCVLMSALLAPA